MKLGPLQPVKGYSTPEIDAVSGRALTLCRSLGDRAKLFPVLYARWASQYVAGRNREAFVLSREYLEAARASGDDAALIVGQRLHAAGLFMRGDAEGARGLAREAVQLYVPERHRPLIARFGQDLRAQSLIYFALSQALLGRIDEARALGDEAIAHARSVDHLNTLGYTLFHCGVWLRAILRETDDLRRHGAELLDLAREHRLGFWRAIVTPYLLEAEEAERAVSGFSARVQRRVDGAAATLPRGRQLRGHGPDGRRRTRAGRGPGAHGAARRRVLGARAAAAERPARHGRGRGRRGGRRVRAAPFGSRASAARICSSCAPPSTSRGCRRRRANRWKHGRCSRRSTPCSPTAADMADVQDARAVLAGLDG